MERLFFINPCFEEELVREGESVFSLIQSHPVYMQLHYLSSLVAKKGERALFMFPPQEGYVERLHKKLSNEYPVLHMQEADEKVEVSSWGASLSLAKWVEGRQGKYQMPYWDVVKQVNGKDFSYQLGPHLPGAELLKTASEALSWCQKVKGPKVLKSLYGASGRGHLILLHEREEEKIAFFMKRVGAVIGEPWVERLLDFSSQWYIEKQTKEYSYVGASICKNSSRGIYRGSLVAPEEVLFASYKDLWQEHLYHAKRALQKMAELGFFGNVGFDAMIYLHPCSQKKQLQPILEINARKTMGWVAVELFHKLKLQQETLFEYTLRKTGKENWLPEEILVGKGKKISLPGEFTVSPQ